MISLYTLGNPRVTMLAAANPEDDDDPKTCRVSTPFELSVH